MQFLEQYFPLPYRLTRMRRLRQASFTYQRRDTLATWGSSMIRSHRAKIDTIVFDVYGLSAPERKLVLDWLGERREALGAEMPPDWRRLNALRATAGAWKDSIDGEQLKQDIRASRDIRTRPVPRL